MEIKSVPPWPHDYGDFRCVPCGTEEVNYPVGKWPGRPPNCRKCGKPMELYAMTTVREQRER